MVWYAKSNRISLKICERHLRIPRSHRIKNINFNHDNRDTDSRICICVCYWVVDDAGTFSFIACFGYNGRSIHESHRKQRQIITTRILQSRRPSLTSLILNKNNKTTKRLIILKNKIFLMSLISIKTKFKISYMFSCWDWWFIFLYACFLFFWILVWIEMYFEY